MEIRTNISRSLLVASLTAVAAMVTFSVHVWALDEVPGQNAAPQSDDLFLFRPDTPVRQVRGAILAERLDRPSLAKGYLTELVNAQPDAPTLLKLRETFGIGEFLRLSMISELQPVSRDLLKLINEATKQEAPTEQMVTTLIGELGASEQQTTSAALKILSAEGTAVRPLLATDISTPQGELASQLLARYARRFRFGLLNELANVAAAEQVRILGLLENVNDPAMAFDLMPYRHHNDADVSRAAIRTTASLNSRTANAETPQQSARLLYDEAMALLKFAATPFSTDNDRRELRAVTDSRPMDGSRFGVLSLKRANELAALAGAIDPEDVRIQALQLVTETTAQSWPAKWPDSLTKGTAVASDVDVAAMEIAVESENSASVLALLTRESAADVLAKNSSVLRSCRHFPDVRVRFAAEYLAGNARRLKTVANIVRDGSTKPELTLIDSRPSVIRRGVAALEELGYSVDAALTGQKGFDVVNSQMACELILVHSNCVKWPLSMTIANLRADYRSRNIPIVVFGPSRDENAIDYLQQRYGGIWFLPQPISHLTFAEAARLAGVPEPRVGEDERKQMIDFARSTTE